MIKYQNMDKVAYIVSKIMNPYTHPAYTLPIIALKYHEPLFLALGGIILLSCLPITLYGILRYFHAVSEDLSLNFERKAFITFTLVLALAVFEIYIIFNVFFLAKIVFIYLVTITISLIVDFIDKISIHVLTVFITFIVFIKYISITGALPVLLVSIIVAWTRVKLKKHSLKQVAWGFATAPLAFLVGDFLITIW